MVTTKLNALCAYVRNFLNRLRRSKTTDTVLCSGVFTVETYDAAEAPTFEAAQSADPLTRQTAENTACVEQFELIVDVLDAGQEVEHTVEGLVVGRGDGPVDPSNRSLDDFVDEVDITEYADDGASITVRSFLSEGEGNVDTGAGETLSEVALVTASGDYFLNHAILDNPLEKDNSQTATITSELTYSAA